MNACAILSPSSIPLFLSLLFSLLFLTLLLPLSLFSPSLSESFSPSIPLGTGLNSLSNSAASVLVGREDMPENAHDVRIELSIFRELLTSNKLENASSLSRMLCNYLNLKKMSGLTANIGE